MANDRGQRAEQGKCGGGCTLEFWGRFRHNGDVTLIVCNEETVYNR